MFSSRPQASTPTSQGRFIFRRLRRLGMVWLSRPHLSATLHERSSGAIRCRRPTVLDGQPASAQGPISDMAVWGRSPDISEWRDVVLESTEVVPDGRGPPSRQLYTAALTGQGMSAHRS